MGCVNYTTRTKLDCGDTLPTSVILCVNPLKVAPYSCPETDVDQIWEYNFIPATLTDVTKFQDGCAPASWKYTFCFDDIFVVPGETILRNDVTGIVCKDCLTTWVEDLVGNESKIVTDGGGAQTFISEHGCEYPINAGGEVCVTDSVTINLSLDGGGCVTGDVNISADIGNATTIQPDGLYTPAGAGGGWALIGDAGTIDTVNFLGTTDNVPHEIRANNLRVRRIEPDPLGPRIIDGCEENAVEPNPGNSVLSGGKPGNGFFGNDTNYIQGGYYSVICGGQDNLMLPSASPQGDLIQGYDTICGGLTNFFQIDNIANGFNTWNPDGFNFIGGGYDNFVIDSEYCTIGGGSVNFILYSSAIFPPTIVVTDYAGFDTIAGGESCYILGYDDTFDPGTAPDYLGKNFVGGGSSNGVEEGIGCTIAGGIENFVLTISSARQNVPQWYNSILGGYGNQIDSTARVTIGGGGTNGVEGQDSSSILGGYLNQIINTTPVTLPGFPAATYKTIDPVNATGVGNAILGGIANWIKDGRESSILGGAFLQIGAYSFGYQNAHTRSFTNINGGEIDRATFPQTTEPPQVDVSAFNDIGYFGDVDIWIGNTDSTARKLKFFEPNADLDFSSTNYSSFEAQAQGADIKYVLPAAAGVAGNSLKILSVVGTTVTLQWA